MTNDGPTIPSQSVPFEGAATAPRTAAPASAAAGWTWLTLLLSLAALVSAWLLWGQFSRMQEQLAQQAAQNSAQAVEARTLAKEAQELVQSANARLTVVEARMAEVNLQRGQLEALVQDLSRSREDTLAEDLEAALRLAVQQAQLTGSSAPLLATLKSASKRLERAAQPRMLLLQRAIERDMERLRQMQVADTASLLLRLDEVLRWVDNLPLQSGQPLGAGDSLPTRHDPSGALAQADAGSSSAVADPAPAPASGWAAWQQRLQQVWQGVRGQAQQLMRVSTITSPEAALLAPDQGLFLRENLKLQLLNARLAVLARQYDAAQTDLTLAQASIRRYFAPDARRTHRALEALAQLQTHLRESQQPTLDDSLTALASVVAGQ